LRLQACADNVAISLGFGNERDMDFFKTVMSDDHMEMTRNQVKQEKTI